MAEHDEAIYTTAIMTRTGHRQQITYRALQLNLTQGTARELATNAVTLYGQGRQQRYNRITCNIISINSRTSFG